MNKLKPIMTKVNNIKREDIEKIINNIILDIESRKGIGNEWIQIDPEIQEEIKNEWRIIVEQILNEK